MAAWDDYTLKEKPGDEDTLMIKDNAATTKANKRTKFSGLWNWIVDKLAAAVIANLNTTNKTVIGALNELNSNTRISISSKAGFQTVINQLKNVYSYPVYIAPDGMSEITQGLVTSSAKGIICAMGGGTIDMLLCIGNGSKVVTGRYSATNDTVTLYQISSQTLN